MMYSNLKALLKRRLTSKQWEGLKLKVLPQIQALRNFLNIIFYVFFWFLPIGFVKSFSRRNNIVLFYDLRVSTYRFDVVTALLAASANVNAGKGKKFDLIVYDPKKGRRLDGPLNEDALDSVRLHYLISVIFEALNVTNHIDEIHYIRSRTSLLSIWLGSKFSHLLPIWYTPFLPRASHLFDDPLKVLKRRPDALPRFIPSQVFNEKVDQYLKSVGVTGGFLTLNIRKKTWEKAGWNLNDKEQSAMIEIALKLKNAGSIEHILLLKDFEEPFETDDDFDLVSKGFIIVPEATLSVRYRVSICSKATVNLCSTNGTSQFALFNSPPCLLFNKDTWTVDNSSIGKFCDLYDNLFVVNDLEVLQTSATFKTICDMIDSPVSISTS